jgi:hypothetical protein
MTSISAAHRSTSTSASHSHLLATPDLAKAFKGTMKGLTYMSESDYPFRFIAAKDNGKGINENNVMRTFYPGIKKDVFTDLQPGDHITIEKQSPKDLREMLKSMGEADPSDSKMVADAKKISQGMNLLVNNLKDVTMFKIGPKDDTTKKLGEDQGLYAYVFVGKSKDGKLAGTYFGSVET